MAREIRSVKQEKDKMISRSIVEAGTMTIVPSHLLNSKHFKLVDGVLAPGEFHLCFQCAPSYGRHGIAWRLSEKILVSSKEPVPGTRESTLMRVLAELKRKGLIRHIGLSNVTAAQVAEAQTITEVVCVQNNYNLAHRHDDALIDHLTGQDIACCSRAELRRAQRAC